MESRNLEHRRANFKGKTQFSAQEVRPGSIRILPPIVCGRVDEALIATR